MKPNRDMVKISVSLPRAMVDWLKDESDRDASSVSQIIRDHVAPAMQQDEPGLPIFSKSQHQPYVGDGSTRDTTGGIDTRRIAAESREPSKVVPASGHKPYPAIQRHRKK